MTKLRPPLLPMDAESVAEIPRGKEWQYEPKWDGFRCLAFRDGGDVYLQSKNQKPLGRYFPEIAGALESLRAKRFVLDGELVIPVKKVFDFDQLLQRIHPAASRVQKLAAEFPARYLVFDLLMGTDGKSLLETPLGERRPRLEEFAERFFPSNHLVELSPASTSLRQARRWAARGRGTVDGVIAKRLGEPYRPGERTAVVKIKPERTADCVVGGFRYGTNSRTIGSLLLGLYDDGLLHHVGFTANIPRGHRKELTKELESIIQPPGFTGRAPGGPSRWSTERSTQWQPVRPHLVAEVAYDHVTGDRFRHGTSFLRWRPDKSAAACSMEQIRR